MDAQISIDTETEATQFGLFVSHNRKIWSFFAGQLKRPEYNPNIKWFCRFESLQSCCNRFIFIFIDLRSQDLLAYAMCERIKWKNVSEQSELTGNH